MEKVFLTPSSVLSKYRADVRAGRRHQRAILSKATLPLPPPSHSFTHHHSRPPFPAPSCASPLELILLGSTNLEQKLVLPPSLLLQNLDCNPLPISFHRRIAVETQISRYPSYRPFAHPTDMLILLLFPLHPTVHRDGSRDGELAIAVLRCQRRTNYNDNVETNR